MHALWGMDSAPTGQVATPVISPANTTHFTVGQTIPVTITSATSGATIVYKYAVNSIPATPANTADGTTYTGSFNLTGTNVYICIVAVGFKGGNVDSEPGFAIYYAP